MVRLKKVKIILPLLGAMLLIYYLQYLKLSEIKPPNPLYSIKVIKVDQSNVISETKDVIPPPSQLAELPSSTMKPQTLTCQLYEKKPFVKAEHTTKDMTPLLCQKFCLQKQTTFMGLTRGDTCICTYQHGSGYVQKDSACDTPCSGDPNISCGGSNKVYMYRIGFSNGNDSWSDWMRYPVSDTRYVRSRYRKCARDINKFTSCTAELEKDYTIADDKATDESVSDHLIGCFTPSSFDTQNSKTPPKYITSSTETSDPSRCLKKCKLSDVRFAVIVDEQCLCTSSLGWSQPADTCIYKVGATVYSVSPISQDSVTLVFESRRTKHLVAVVAHYRGGSTLASAFFYLNKGSLSVYELDKLMGSKWPNVSIMGKEEERSAIFLSKLYPAWFYCDSIGLPGIFYRLFPKSANQFNTGFESLAKCQKKVKITEVATLCASYLRETCLMSPIVSAKTVRILHSTQLKLAVQTYPDLQYVHVLRDPRAMQASRVAMIKWYGEDQVSRLRDLCWECAELHDVFGSSSNTHVIHYEDMASDVIQSASNLYKSINVTFTEDMKERLRKLNGDGAVRKSGFDIVQKDPKSRINAWLQNKNVYDVIRKAEMTDECQQMLKYFSDYYQPLDKLLAASNIS